MGYMRNHLATVSTAAFALVLTGLWFYFLDYAPILHFVFIMAVPITWFLALTCWLAQKSTDYSHKPSVPNDADQSAVVSTPIISVANSGNQTPQNVERQVGAVSYASSNTSDRNP